MTDTDRLEHVIKNGWNVLEYEHGYLVFSITGRPIGSGDTYRAAIDNAVQRPSIFSKAAVA